MISDETIYWNLSLCDFKTYCVELYRPIRPIFLFNCVTFSKNSKYGLAGIRITYPMTKPIQNAKMCCITMATSWDPISRSWKLSHIATTVTRFKDISRMVHQLLTYRQSRSAFWWSLTLIVSCLIVGNALIWYDDSPSGASFTPVSHTISTSTLHFDWTDAKRFWLTLPVAQIEDGPVDCWASNLVSNTLPTPRQSQGS